MKNGFFILFLSVLVGCASPVKEKGVNLIWLQDAVIARQGDMYALADSCGYLRTGYIYEELDLLSNNLFLARANGKYLLVGSGGEEISGRSYVTFEYCFNGYGIVSADGKYGLVKTTGEEVLPLEYTQVRFIAPDLVAAAMPGYTEVADLQGRLVARVEEEIDAVASDALQYVMQYESKLTEDQLYWSDILDRYDSLCTSCLQAKSIIGSYGKLPSEDMRLLMREAEQIKAALQQARGRMTDMQLERFKEITERYGN